MARQTQVVQIREAECIGCTKCIDACPVDAIIGSRQLMHTVILEECIGCELCLPPCPVDCIDVMAAANVLSVSEKTQRAVLLKKRYKAKKNRLQQQDKIKVLPIADSRDIKAYVKSALLRAKTKK